MHFCMRDVHHRWDAAKAKVHAEYKDKECSPSSTKLDEHEADEQAGHYAQLYDPPHHQVACIFTL